MPPADPHKVVRTAVKSGTFDPVYLFHGDDDFLKEDALRQLLEAAVDPATRDFNLEVRRAAELNAETLGSLLGTPPMMAERRVLVLRDPGALKKDARAALDRYLAKPAADGVVILVAPAGGKVDKALLDRTHALDFGHLTGDRLPRWIAHHAGTLGASITDEAVSLLQDATGNDLAMLALELEKLAAFTSGGDITEQAVAAVVGVRREETTSAFFDAVAARDAAAALALLPGLLRQPKVNGVQLVIGLSTQMLGIGYARTLRDRGVPTNQIPSQLIALMKETGAYPMRAWGEAVSCWTKAAAGSAWTVREVDRALELLLAADRALKDTRLSSDEQLLASMVLSICGAPARAGRPRAA